MTASSEKRETLNRDRFCNMTRRFQTHGAWPPGHLANPARIRHSAMHAPNRGALDRNGSADRCLWQGQQQKLNGKEREELEVIPLQIDDLEKEQASISERLGDPEIYKNRPADVVSLQENLKIIEGKLSALMSRWEDLLERSNS
jgi:hypothetical protein